MGWPYSTMTRFVISTMLLMGLRPTLRSFFCIQAGEGSILMSVTTRAQ